MFSNNKPIKLLDSHVLINRVLRTTAPPQPFSPCGTHYHAINCARMHVRKSLALSKGGQRRQRNCTRRIAARREVEGEQTGHGGQRAANFNFPPFHFWLPVRSHYAYAALTATKLLPAIGHSALSLSRSLSFLSFVVILPLLLSSVAAKTALLVYLFRLKCGSLSIHCFALFLKFLTV